MAIRNIIQLGDPTLRKKSFSVSDFGEKTHQLLDDMRETLIKSQGVGLAAVQVGILRRIFIVSVEDKYFECINPEIIDKSGKQTDREGCLSVRGKWGMVERPMNIVCRAQDRNGKFFTVKASGFLARVFCHEYDHLDGIVYVDKAKDVEDE